MANDPHAHLSRRERQIMNVIYRLGRAGVQEVREHLEDPPSYSAVRAHLRVLEEKGHVRHQQEGHRYLFTPTLSRERARRSALKGLLRNFFDGSHQELMAALLEDSGADLTAGELKKLRRKIEQARGEGR